MGTRKSLKDVARPHLGVSSAHKGYVVKVAWTSAKVFSIVATKAHTLDVIEAEMKKDSLVALKHIAYEVHAGDVLYFAQSDDHPGYYYICRWNGHHFCCTCPAGCAARACHHQQDVSAYILLRIETEKDRESDPAILKALDAIAASFTGEQAA